MQNNLPDFLLAKVDPSSKQPGTEFPLDCYDLSDVSNQKLISLLETAPTLHQLGGTKIVRISTGLVLKGGDSVLAAEARAMQLAAQLTTLRLPRVHLSFNIDNPSRGYYQTTGYIVMDYVEGHSLDAIWKQLDQDQQKNIIAQVAEMIGKMQSVNLHTPGPVGGGPCQGIWFSIYGAGPFQDSHAVQNWFNHKLQVCKRFQKVADDAPPFEFSSFVLTHQDITPRNLVLDNLGNIWLIDWAFAGVYPPAFETAAIAQQLHFPDF